MASKKKDSQAGVPQARGTRQGGTKRQRHDEEMRQKAGRLYRAGVLTVVEVAKQCGISTNTLNKWANDYGWKRDFAKRVREAAGSLEAAKIASEYVSQTNPISDDEAVEAAARIQVEVTSRHKKDLITAVDLQMQLIGELQIVSSHVDKLEEFIKDETKDDKTGQRRATMQAAIGIGTRMKAMQAASNSLTALIKTQRLVYRIADKGESDEAGYEEMLKKVLGTDGQ